MRIVDVVSQVHVDYFVAMNPNGRRWHLLTRFIADKAGQTEVKERTHSEIEELVQLWLSDWLATPDGQGRTNFYVECAKANIEEITHLLCRSKAILNELDVPTGWNAAFRRE